MRFTILALILLFALPSDLLAMPPAPSLKPVTATQDNNENESSRIIISRPPTKPEDTSFSETFDAVIEKVANVLDTDGDIYKDGIVTPPPLPAQKQVILGSDNNQIIDGVPIPITKPYKVTTITAQNDNRTGQQKDENVVIRYRNNNGDDRMAGRVPSAPELNRAERTYAENVGRLRETQDQSPFLDGRMPQAAKSMSDPIILFFKEQSTTMEVGQMSILKDEVLRPLQRSTRSTITINGYAENINNRDETQRLSLSRALMIREYLINNRIDESRIRVQALADSTPVQPKDRVDIAISR